MEPRPLRAFFGMPSTHPETGLRLSRPYPVALADVEFAEGAVPFEVDLDATLDEPPVDEEDLHVADNDPNESGHEDGWYDGFEDFDQP